MSRTASWRDQFIAEASRSGMAIDTVLAILRVGRTLQRLAEAQCNGDWPADNGDKDRQVQCGQCMSGWHKSAIRKDGRCLDCHAQDRARRLVPAGWTAEFQGDPRGCIVTLVDPSGKRIGVP